jgi:hypothetical protein
MEPERNNVPKGSHSGESREGEETTSANDSKSARKYLRTLGEAATQGVASAIAASLVTSLAFIATTQNDPPEYKICTNIETAKEHF